MAAPFALARDGTIAVSLSREEADALARVAEDVAGLVEQPPTSPVQRLFPPAYDHDERLEEEYRALTREELVRAKKSAAEGVVATLREARDRRGGVRTRLDEEGAREWLSVLNDARLVLGTQLDITEESYGRLLPPSDPRAPAHNLYLWLSALEESLVAELLESLPSDR